MNLNYSLERDTGMIMQFYLRMSIIVLNLLTNVYFCHLTFE